MKFIDDFLDYCRDFTGSPEPFIRWSGLLALSAVAGEKHILRRGDWDVRPNLWVLLLGNSSSYKSVALHSARRLLHEAVPGILASQEYSHEALIEDIALNPHRLFIYDEAESYFKMISQKYNAPMRSAMMSLYNGVPIQRQIKGKDGKGETHTIERAYICWGGATTPVQVSAHMNGSTTDLLSGMFPRFLIVPYFGPESPVEDPPPADHLKRDRLVNRLKYLSLMGERVYTYTEAGLAAKSKWLGQFNKRANSSEVLLAAFYRKMRDEHFHKIAMLSAFERESNTIDIEDVAEAISMLWPVERELVGMVARVTEKEWDRESMRVQDFLKKKKKCDRTDILRACRGIRGQKLTAILAGFFQDRQIVTTEKLTDGRTRSIIEWVAD